MNNELKKLLILCLEKLNLGSIPDFIIVGAQKAGTTSLYNYLLQHPKVNPSLKKEVHYFDLNYSESLKWYKAHFFFKKVFPNSITGESSPLYLYHPSVPKRLKKTFPKIKLIILLRNPKDRAVSHFKHLRHKKIISQSVTLSDMIKIEMSRRREQSGDEYYDPIYSIIHRGEYFSQIKRWYNYFPKNQFLVLNSEFFFSNPKESLFNILNFLDLDSYQFDFSKKFNVSKKEIGSAPSTEILNEMDEYFRESNENLYKILDKKFAWSA